jgi:hypothetical protein
MATELLVTERFIEDGRQLIKNLVRTGFEIAVAFWVRRGDGDSLGPSDIGGSLGPSGPLGSASFWGRRGSLCLYLASPQVVPKHTRDATTRLYDEVQKLRSSAFDFSDLRLISDKDSAAREAMEHRDRSWQVSSGPVQVTGRLGDLTVEWAYIYERITKSLTREEVIQTVVALMQRTGQLQPSTMTLRDGSDVQGVPIALEMSVAFGVTVSLEDSATGTRRMIPVDAITTID